MGAHTFMSRKILTDKENSDRQFVFGHTDNIRNRALGGTDAREEQKTSKQTGHVGKRKTEYKLTINKFSLGIKRKLLICISKGGNSSN